MDCCCCSVDVTPYDSTSNDKLKEDLNRDKHDDGCFGCLQRRLHILPIVSTVWFGISIITSYAISVSLGHTEADFPYISYTATGHPEANIFAQMINIGAVLLILTSVVRYLYVKDTLRRHMATSGWYKANIASLVFGIITALGFSIVSNFQTDRIKSVHYIGAAFGFGGGVVYCWIQTCITWKLYRRELNRGNVAIVQTVSSISLCFFLIIYITVAITKLTYNIQRAADVGTKYDSLRSVYLVSTITEWLAVVMLNVVMLTFIPDFKSIKISSPYVYQLIDSEDRETKETNV